MKILLSKKEAGLPLYLILACEELRVFGIYEKVWFLPAVATELDCNHVVLSWTRQHEQL